MVFLIGCEVTQVLLSPAFGGILMYEICVHLRSQDLVLETRDSLEAALDAVRSWRAKGVSAFHRPKVR